jgi:RNA polymerase-associated protein
MKDNLTAIAPAFMHKPYFMSDEYTLVDCCMAPLLWRLPIYGVKLPASARQVEEYADRLFARDTFQSSLSEAEKEMRGLVSI